VGSGRSPGSVRPVRDGPQRYTRSVNSVPSLRGFPTAFPTGQHSTRLAEKGRSSASAPTDNRRSRVQRARSET
jgi:hypothetical protein